MSRNPLAFVVLFACIGGVLIIAAVGQVFGAWDKPEPTAAPAVMAVQATATLQPTATSTPIPTVDYSAVWPAQTAAAAADDLADSAERVASAASTLSAATEQAINHALMIGTPTAIANATAWAQATSDAVAKQQALYVAEEHERILADIERERQAAQNAETLRFWFSLFGGAGGLAVFVAAVNFVGYRAKLATWSKSAPAVDVLQDMAEPEQQAPAYPAGLDIRLFHHIANADQLREIARGIAEGVTLTHDNWTPAEKCLSEGRFASLQHVLVKYGAAQWADETHKGGVELTQKGARFFADILETTPPPAADVPQTPSGAGFQSIDSDFTPL